MTLAYDAIACPLALQFKAWDTFNPSILSQQHSRRPNPLFGFEVLWSSSIYNATSGSVILHFSHAVTALELFRTNKMPGHFRNDVLSYLNWPSLSTHHRSGPRETERRRRGLSVSISQLANHLQRKHSTCTVAKVAVPCRFSGSWDERPGCYPLRLLNRIYLRGKPRSWDHGYNSSSLI